MRISKVKGLRPWQMEKHYLMAIILNLLSDYNLVFKGGTYLWFFHGLPRFSEDLDFTATGRIPTDLAQKVSDGVKIYGTENELKVITDNSTTFSFRIIANGPLNTSIKDRCVVYVEISKRENVIQDRFPLKMDFPEYSIPVKRISGMNLDEVGSEKVRAILTRKKGRDMYEGSTSCVAIIKSLSEKEILPLSSLVASFFSTSLLKHTVVISFDLPAKLASCCILYTHLPDSVARSLILYSDSYFISSS